MAQEKHLKFSVQEITGRTFEIPLSKVKELLEENADGDTSDWNECDIASFLYNEISDDISEYEKENCYFDNCITDEEITD